MYLGGIPISKSKIYGCGGSVANTLTKQDGTQNKTGCTQTYSRPLAILLTGSMPSGRTECQARFLSVDLRLVVRTQVAKLSTPIFSGGCGESTSTTFQVVDGATLSHQSNPVFYHIFLRNPHPSKYCTGMGLSSLVSEKCGTACATLAAP